MQVTNLKLESNMKEELLEAIYGTVERLEQKVDELSASTKNAGAETVPASNDINKLDTSINAMFIKEEEVRGKISKLRDAIVVFADLIKVELGKNEQRSKFLVDAVKQMRQGNDVSSKALQDKLEVMNKSPQKKVISSLLFTFEMQLSSFHNFTFICWMSDKSHSLMESFSIFLRGNCIVFSLSILNLLSCWILCSAINH